MHGFKPPNDIFTVKKPKPQGNRAKVNANTCTKIKKRPPKSFYGYAPGYQTFAEICKPTFEQVRVQLFLQNQIMLQKLSSSHYIDVIILRNHKINVTQCVDALQWLLYLQHTSSKLVTTELHCKSRSHHTVWSATKITLYSRF